MQYVRALQNEAGSNIKTLYRILDTGGSALLVDGKFQRFNAVVQNAVQRLDVAARFVLPVSYTHLLLDEDCVLEALQYRAQEKVEV